MTRLERIEEDLRTHWHPTLRTVPQADMEWLIARLRQCEAALRGVPIALDSDIADGMHDVDWDGNGCRTLLAEAETGAWDWSDCTCWHGEVRAALAALSERKERQP